MVAQDVNISLLDRATLDLSAMTPTEVVTLRVRAALLRRLGWLQELWSAPEAPPGWFCAIHNGDDPEAQRVWSGINTDGLALSEMIALCDDALEGDAGRYRKRLVDLTGLGSAELDLLDLTLAIEAVPALADLCHACGEPGATERLARAAFGTTDGLPLWRAGSPLARWRLLNEVRRGVLQIDPQIQHFVGGALSIDPLLAQYAEEIAPGPALTSWPIATEIERLAPLLRGNTPVQVNLAARRGNKAEQFAAHVARGLGYRLLAITLPEGADHLTQNELTLRAERLALLGDFALFWHGVRWEQYPARPIGTMLMFTGPSTVAAPGRIAHQISLHAPQTEDRIAILRQTDAAHLDVSTLASRRGATLDDLEAVARFAPGSAEDAIALLDQRLAGRPSTAGRTLSPSRDWSDLILAPGTLQALLDLTFEATIRIEGDVPHPLLSAGMPVLLHGEPGTGKTLAAEVIANALGLEMLLVDVASIISKYVGETSKNLRDAFTEAAESSALLFFDEADTFFVKRTEVKDTHDKHSNADTNYLLQLIAAHPGITLLATNRRSDIDPAFFRRLRHVVEIPRPGPDERSALWSLNLSRVGVEADTQRANLIDMLAGFSELSPAQIEGAAISAHFAARQAGRVIDAEALAVGIDRELAKEGRALDRKSRTRLTRHGIEESTS